MPESVLQVAGMNPVSFVRKVSVSIDPNKVFNNGVEADGVLANFNLYADVKFEKEDGTFVFQSLNVSRDAFVAAEYQLLKVLCDEVNKQLAENRGLTLQCMDLTGSGLNREYILTLTVNLSKWSKDFVAPTSLEALFPVVRNTTLPEEQQDVISGTALYGAGWETIVMDGLVGETYMNNALNDVKNARSEGVISGLKTFLPNMDVRAISHPGQ